MDADYQRKFDGWVKAADQGELYVNKEGRICDAPPGVTGWIQKAVGTVRRVENVGQALLDEVNAHAEEVGLSSAAEKATLRKFIAQHSHARELERAADTELLGTTPADHVEAILKLGRGPDESHEEYVARLDESLKQPKDVALASKLVAGSPKTLNEFDPEGSWSEGMARLEMLGHIERVQGNERLKPETRQALPEVRDLILEATPLQKGTNRAASEKVRQIRDGTVRQALFSYTETTRDGREVPMLIQVSQVHFDPLRVNVTYWHSDPKVRGESFENVDVDGFQEYLVERFSPEPYDIAGVRRFGVRGVVEYRRPESPRKGAWHLYHQLVRFAAEQDETFDKLLLEDVQKRWS
jgi:hypothetical protein